MSLCLLSNKVGKVLPLQPDPEPQVTENEFVVVLDKEPLNDKNWLVYAIKNYNNPNCSSTAEAYEDFRRFKYLRKLFTKFERGGELKERLILNHIIVLTNVLGPQATTRLLFLKVANHKALKPFLIALSILPKLVINIRGLTYETDTISLDGRVVEALRKAGIGR